MSYLISELFGKSGNKVELTVFCEQQVQLFDWRTELLYSYSWLIHKKKMHCGTFLITVL